MARSEAALGGYLGAFLSTMIHDTSVATMCRLDAKATKSEMPAGFEPAPSEGDRRSIVSSDHFMQSFPAIGICDDSRSATGPCLCKSAFIPTRLELDELNHKLV